MNFALQIKWKGRCPENSTTNHRQKNTTWQQSWRAWLKVLNHEGEMGSTSGGGKLSWQKKTTQTSGNWGKQRQTKRTVKDWEKPCSNAPTGLRDTYSFFQKSSKLINILARWDTLGSSCVIPPPPTTLSLYLSQSHLNQFSTFVLVPTFLHWNMLSW